MEERKLVHENEWLYRRSWLPERKFLNPDGSATSRVFKLKEKDNGELSVDVKSMTTANIAVLDKGNFFLFELLNKSVILITSPQLTTYLDPLLNGANNAHAVITGMALEDEITPGILAKATKKSIILIPHHKSRVKII